MEWGYCFDCRRSGDPIELAAATWKIPVAEAIRRLAIEGVPIPPESLSDDAIDVYLKQSQLCNRKVYAHWQRARQQLVQAPSSRIALLRQRLGIKDTLSRERALEGPAAFFGASRAPAIEKLLFGKERHRKMVFQGRGWDDILVVPYFNAPGKIAALYCIGREGLTEDRVLKPINMAHKSVYQEIGLAGLEAVLEHPSPYVIATSDVHTMLRLQVQNFHASLRPLPMVAWYNGPKGKTQESWAVLGNRRLVFWATRLDAATLLQCRHTGGHLVLLGPDSLGRKRIDRFLRQQTPLDLTKKLVAKAKPWQEVVAAWLANRPETEVQSLVRQLTESGHDAREILAECGGEQILVRRQVLTPSRRVTYKNRTYTERNDRWYTGGADTLALNAIIRVEKIVLRKKQVEYVGFLRIGGKDLGFRFDQREIDNKGFLTLLQQLALSHKSRLYWSNYSFQSLALPVAMAFHEPEIVKGKTRVGWDGKGFRFRHFSFYSGQSRTHDDWLLPPDCPGPQVTAFRLGRTVKSQLSTLGPEAEWTWAVTVSLLSAVIAPGMALAGPGTLVLGNQVKEPARQLLARCGVPLRRLWRLWPERREFCPVHWPHRWPVALLNEDSLGLRRQYEWLQANNFTGMVCLIEPILGHLLIRQGGFLGVEYRGPFRGQVLARMPVEHGVLAYLRYLSGQKRTPARTNDGTSQWGHVQVSTTTDAGYEGHPRGQLRTLWLSVQADLAGWLEEEGVKTAALRAASRWMHFQEDEDAGEQIVRSLYFAGVLRPDNGKQYIRSVPVQPSSAGLTVTREQILRALSLVRLDVLREEDLPETVFVPAGKFL